jgi:hypothetical protein
LLPVDDDSTQFFGCFLSSVIISLRGRNPLPLPETKMSRGRKKLAHSTTTTGDESRRRENHSLYKYALEEYAQAVPPGSSNDDGSMFSGWSSLISGTNIAGRTTTTTMPAAPSSVPSSRGESPAPPASRRRMERSSSSSPDHHAGDSDNGNHSDPESRNHFHHHHRRTLSHPFRLDMPDATYEEIYGEAYTGGTIKYMYPSGYQSMRPRSGPWKLSIAISLLFTWISIFIVVHCSDRADGYDFTQVDDDHLIIDIRWCGSRPLYLMWVASMLITGLSAAYCSVIGYIKVRDFAVANSRSQPPGVLDGKSDYYVSNENNIYQADGEPQFWGSQIYRPTQAAVAVTSR